METVAKQMIPERKCNYYNPDTHDTCTKTASHVVTEAYNNDFVLCFSCTEHTDSRPGLVSTSYPVWYCKYVLNMKDQETDWDLE
jgi:hypothetical protein